MVQKRLEAMRREHCEAADATVRWMTGNYFVTTNALTEWWFVEAPFETEKQPEEIRDAPWPVEGDCLLDAARALAGGTRPDWLDHRTLAHLDSEDKWDLLNARDVTMLPTEQEKAGWRGARFVDMARSVLHGDETQKKKVYFAFYGDERRAEERTKVETDELKAMPPKPMRPAEGGVGEVYDEASDPVAARRKQLESLAESHHEPKGGWSQAERSQKVRELFARLHLKIQEKDSSDRSRGIPPIQSRDKVLRAPRALSEFSADRRTKDAQLSALGLPPITDAELIGLRLYTGPMFEKYNNMLRYLGAHLPFMKRFFEETNKGNRYTNTVHTISEAIGKLSKLTPPYKLYKGTGAGLRLPDKFLKPGGLGYGLDGDGNAADLRVRGGVEFAFMSSTPQRSVALHYAKDKHPQMVFEIQQGMVDRGAEIMWLSQYPGEVETVWPPLTGLEVQMEERTQTITLPELSSRADGTMTFEYSPRGLAARGIGEGETLVGGVLGRRTGVVTEADGSRAEEVLWTLPAPKGKKQGDSHTLRWSVPAIYSDAKHPDVTIVKFWPTAGGTRMPLLAPPAGYEAVTGQIAAVPKAAKLQAEAPAPAPTPAPAPAPAPVHAPLHAPAPAAAAASPAEPTPEPAVASGAGQLVVRSTGTKDDPTKGRVAVTDAEAAAAALGAGYDVATKEEVIAANPAEHRGNWHWAWARVERNAFVKMANYGSVEQPDWKYLGDERELSQLSPSDAADWVYVVERPSPAAREPEPEPSCNRW